MSAHSVSEERILHIKSVITVHRKDTAKFIIYTQFYPFIYSAAGDGGGGYQSCYL